MKVNEETVIVGEKVVLVPYRKEHVAKYNAWMQDPQLQELTASEPLTLEQEYEMQTSWHLDDDKLTFIVLSRSDDSKAGKITGTNALLAQCDMAGDVNVFISELEETDDGENAEPAAPLPVKYKGELEVMIAESKYRRLGLAREALDLLLHYVTASPTPTPPGRTGTTTTSLPLTASNLFVKISLKNQPSIDLFRQLGFAEHKVSEVWQELEMRYQHTERSSPGKAPLEVCRWHLQ